MEAIPDPHNVALGRAIRALREKTGLSPEELATRAEVPVEELDLLEAGSAEADWGTLRHIAKGLGASLSDLFQLVDELESD